MESSSASVKELTTDHRTIEKALNALSKEIEKASAGAKLDAGFIREACLFSQSFVDKCHHGKEEGCFFPCLERRGMPHDAGPIAVMLAEHEQGRRLVAQILESLSRYEEGTADAASVIEPCKQYHELLTQHILKEEGILFPTGDRLMEGSDDEETSECFERKEQSLGEEHERLTSWAHDLT